VEAAALNMEPFFMLSGSSFLMMAQIRWRLRDLYLRRCFDVLAGIGAMLMLVGVFA
jgi:multisubunit Na+/H+ antiporter MnhG subunit